MPTVNIFELMPRFRKSNEYSLMILGFLLAQCTCWKWQNFKCCRCAKFSPCHCKSKIPGHLKLSTQMSTLNIFELRQRFRKSVEYRWRYWVFAGTVCRLKVAKFQIFSMYKVFTLPLQKKTTWAPESFRPNAQPQYLRPEAKISKIGWMPLEIQDFCSHSVQVESGKISNVVDAQVFTWPLQN